MVNNGCSVFFVLLLICYEGNLEKADGSCEIPAHIDSGWICGALRLADDGSKYASFRGIPYAKQPVGLLRFKELEPVTPWNDALDTIEEGPICPQHDEVYDHLMKPRRGMSEACIYANVHVPLRDKKHGPKGWKESDLPILVFIHGGGFQAGSGDADVNGPEYLVSRGIIVITFNYRLNVFGFLSLNSPVIPGNQGLRDQVTLLRWVQRNARAFGGDPDDVTLMGQSAGASSAHLLSLSEDTDGLFKRLILMSGSANSAFFTTSPLYSQLVASLFLAKLGINSTDPVIIHDELVKMPLEDILLANSDVQYTTGVISFSPVTEVPNPGVTRIIDDDPIELIKKGRGDRYPTIIGFTSAECEFSKPRLIYLEALKRIENNPLVILGLMTTFRTPPNVALRLASRSIERYFKDKPTYERFMISCTETNFHYPAFQLADLMTSRDGAPVFLYKYSYESEYNLIKDARNLKYNGSAHVEDLEKVLRFNAALGKQKLPDKDKRMVDWMTQFIINFMKCSNPTCMGYGMKSPWPAVDQDLLNYQLVSEPGMYINTEPTPYEWDMIRFFDRIHSDAERGALESPLTLDGLEAAALLKNATAEALLLNRPPYAFATTYKSIKSKRKLYP